MNHTVASIITMQTRIDRLLRELSNGKTYDNPSHEYTESLNSVAAPLNGLHYALETAKTAHYNGIPHSSITYQSRLAQKLSLVRASLAQSGNDQLLTLLAAETPQKQDFKNHEDYLSWCAVQSSDAATRIRHVLQYMTHPNRPDEPDGQEQPPSRNSGELIHLDALTLGLSILRDASTSDQLEQTFRHTITTTVTQPATRSYSTSN